MTSRSPWLGARSNIAGIEFPAILGGPAATLAALVHELEQTQWFAPAEIERAQFGQLRQLAQYAAQFSPHFRKRMVEAKLRPADLTSFDALRRLPLLSRRDLQSGRGLACTEVPKAHQPIGETKTSGSTGEPVAVKRSAINQLMWMAQTLREHIWIGSDFSAPLAAIRANFFEIRQDPDWGQPASILFRTGPALRLPITLSVEKLIEHIAAFKPSNLIVYPNTLDAIAAECAKRETKFDGLRAIRSIGETLRADIRARAQEVFGVPIVDNYSSQEFGNIALQCPQSGLYHTMAEGVILEVIDERGQLCAEGQVGRVVLTDLHNLAMPLVRYDIGDYAETCAPCPCGRGLPTLKRIVGRERNLIVMPDGTRHWPLVGFHAFRDFAPVIQYQLIQTSRSEIEVRLVVEQTLSASQEGALGEVIQKALGYPFELTFRYFDGVLPRGSNGKFDEFVCNVRP